MIKKRLLLALLCLSVNSAWAEDKKSAEQQVDAQLPFANKNEFFKKVADGSITEEMLQQMRDVAGSASYSGEDGESILVVSACRFLLSDNRREFENSLKILKEQYPHSDFSRKINSAKFNTDCSDCEGTGKKSAQCSACIGTGQCSSCRGTGSLEPTFRSPSARSKRCSRCKATGKCKTCGGTGRVFTACKKCRGKGKSFSVKLRNDFFSSCLADTVDRHEKGQLVIKIEKERLSRQEKELETLKEVALLEAQIVAKERANQERALIREEADRIRKEEANIKYASLDRRYLKSIVLIGGDQGCGTGFLCTLDGRNVVLSNAHVLLGNRKLKMKTIAGKVLEYSAIRVCKGRDIVAYELKSSDNLSFLNIHNNVAEMSNHTFVTQLSRL